MSLLRLTLDSLRFHRRIHFAVALGVAVCTAVLTGALLIGDSMRGSLRHLTLDRLGRIDEVLLTRQFFRTELVNELSTAPEFSTIAGGAQPAIFLIGTLENPDEDHARAGQVSVFGTLPEFWTLGNGGPAARVAEGEVVLNQPLAEQLRASIGDDVLLRLPQLGEIPADSPLGRKTETVQSRRFRVAEIIPAEGLGRFGLRPNQQLPRNAYVSLGSLQQLVDRKDKANAIIVAGHDGVQPAPASHDELQSLLKPKLEDYGLSIVHVRKPEGSEPVLNYFNFTSSGMMLEEPVEAASERAFQQYKPQAALTYLANSITLGEHSIPYSIISGIDNRADVGPLFTADGVAVQPLADDEIVLNSWAADDLGAAVGDEISVTYFEPENTHGEVTEAIATFRLKAVVPLAAKGEPLRAANDPDLTPELPGVTDQASIDDWNPPFPFDQSRVRDKDEAYWDDHRTTPKAFVSLATARKLWSSRFGSTTSIRIPYADGLTAESLTQRALAELSPSVMGFEFLPVKQQGLQASSGTTPFDGLFLGFSFFIIASAVMLVSLLFRLGMDQRTPEVGLLYSIGFSQGRTWRLLALENFIVAAVGGALGVAGGLVYADLMITGLRTWWRAAITTPFIELYVTPVSLIIGYLSGVLISTATIAWTLRQMRRIAPRQLLAGESTDLRRVYRSSKIILALAVVAVLLAIVCAGVGLQQSGEMQAAAFFGSGAFFLIAALLFVWERLRAGTLGLMVGVGGSLSRLVLRNGARNPSRSTLTIGLVAAASFLIIAFSAFRLSAPSGEPDRNSGDGGFLLVAESSQPIYQDVNSEVGREDLGIGTTDSTTIAAATIYGLRVQSGDDASCLNLYQPTQPTMLGLSDALIERGGFRWTSSLAQTDAERANPWLLLKQVSEHANDPTPIVLDNSTAAYSLKVGLGDTFDVEDDRGRTIQLKVVGLLNNSMLQGNILMSEHALLRHFPDVNGRRFFMIEAPTAQAAAIGQALEAALGDFGFDVESSRDRLESFMAVQNTYLSTFQSLGGLGLLLGTIGLAIVQLRSVLERRKELALMRAAGFRRSRLATMVMLENALLLLGGLGIGVVTALVAVLPHLISGGAGIPVRSLIATLLVVLVVGLLAGLAAVRATLRAPLVGALRGD